MNINLEIKGEAEERFNQTKKEYDIDNAELIRRAMALYDLCLIERKAGNALVSLPANAVARIANLGEKAIIFK